MGAAAREGLHPRALCPLPAGSAHHAGGAGAVRAGGRASLSRRAPARPRNTMSAIPRRLGPVVLLGWLCALGACRTGDDMRPKETSVLEPPKVPAATPPPSAAPPQDDEIARYLRRLRSDLPEERDQAARWLIAHAEQAEPRVA